MLVLSSEGCWFRFPNRQSDFTIGSLSMALNLQLWLGNMAKYFIAIIPLSVGINNYDDIIHVIIFYLKALFLLKLIQTMKMTTNSMDRKLKSIFNK